MTNSRIPFNEEDTLACLASEEFDQLPWLDRKLGLRKSSVKSTGELANHYREPVCVDGETTTFKPFKFDYILLTIGGLILTGLIISAVQYPEDTQGFTRVFFFLVIFAFIGIITVKFDPTRNLEIVLGGKGISINEFNYQWSEIYNTYIIKRRNSKTTQYFLILALDTGLTDRFEITGLMAFYDMPIKLAAYIEYYKTVDVSIAIK